MGFSQSSGWADFPAPPASLPPTSTPCSKHQAPQTARYPSPVCPSLSCPPSPLSATLMPRCCSISRMHLQREKVSEAREAGRPTRSHLRGSHVDVYVCLLHAAVQALRYRTLPQGRHETAPSNAFAAGAPSRSSKASDIDSKEERLYARGATTCRRDALRLSQLLLHHPHRPRSGVSGQRVMRRRSCSSLRSKSHTYRGQ